MGRPRMEWRTVCEMPDCGKPHRSRGLCEAHYQKQIRARRTERAVERLDELAALAAPTESGCWLWQGKLDPNGYGLFGGVNAHRAMYVAVTGETPARGMHLDHLCRTPTCVNPHHLEVVTPSENVGRGLAGYGIRKLCKSGKHDITNPANWYTRTHGRTCLACYREREAQRPPRHRT